MFLVNFRQVRAATSFENSHKVPPNELLTHRAASEVASASRRMEEPVPPPPPARSTDSMAASMRVQLPVEDEKGKWAAVRYCDAADVKGVIRLLTAKLGVRERYYQDLFALRMSNRYADVSLSFTLAH